MRDALRYEVVRLRTIRSTWWLSAIALVFGVGISALGSFGTNAAFNSAHPPTPGDLPTMGPGLATQFAVLGAPVFLAFVLAMTGIFAWGHEYRHGMIRATLTALSSRTGAWVAKYVVVAVWVLTVSLVTMLLATLVGWLWLRDDGVEFFTSEVAQGIGRTLVYTLVFTWLAMAFTALVRNQTAALVLMFLWPLAVESIVTLIFTIVPGLRSHVGLTRFLPFNAGSRIVNTFDRAHGTFGDPLDFVGGLVIFGGVTAVLMVLSLALFRSRDA